MNYQMLMGETLFHIDSTLSIDWKPEEYAFLYHGEPFRQRIAVQVNMVPELPNLLTRTVYEIDGMKIGVDENGNEVRLYDAPFLDGRPVYAASVLRGSEIVISFVDNRSLWNNPNIRIWNMVHMERLLLNVGALVLHCSYLMYENRAILFSAPSGTGKTTQAKLWEKLYPAKIINGDKAIIQKKGETWYACGYPFHGSAAECLNEQYPIEAVVVVRQNPVDSIEELRMMKKVQAIYSETTVSSWDSENVNRALNLITELVSEVKVICQQCTMKDEACRTLHRYLREEKHGPV